MENPYLAVKRNWNNKFTKSNMFEVCSICRSEKDVEMHHVISIKSLRDPKGTKLDWFTRGMLAINRKQVPLCS
jgi:hypothetical protein